MPSFRTGQTRSVMQIPLEPGGQSTDKSAGSANSASTSRPCLQDTTMVPNSTSHAHRSPSVDNSGTRGSGQQGSHAPTSSISRMAHLRKKFRDQTFLKKLQHSCSNHGEPKQTNRMTPSSVNGIAGVLNGVMIHFQDL